MEFKHEALGKNIIYLILFYIVLTGVVVFVTIGSFHQKADRQMQEQKQKEILALNEIEQKTLVHGESPAQKEIRNLQQEIRKTNAPTFYVQRNSMIIIYTLTIVLLLGIYLYLYLKMMRPFYRLEKFAFVIAKGELDEPLEYERNNMFGAFTWAFDHMRKELLKAKQAQKEAILNNKTVIATLSHDIKTPIASILTYVEALEANMDTSYEKRSRYLSVILRKCNEVKQLTDDLFLHSISDLNQLTIKKDTLNLTTLLNHVIQEQQIAGMQIIRDTAFWNVTLLGDEKRMTQVFLNIFSNAQKYAPNQRVHVWMELESIDSKGCKPNNKLLSLHFRDDGKGADPADIPFLLEKFYRGKNVSKLQGSGLGLFLVDYVIKQMEGKVELKNSSNGLEVILYIPMIEGSFDLS